MTTLEELKPEIEACMLRDRHVLLKRLAKARSLDVDAQEGESKNILKKIEASRTLVEQRKNSTFTLDYPESLPVSQRIDDIKSAILENQVVVVAGETGSGKTTQIPKACIELGLADYGYIGHTQPRRLAARTVSNRIADELNCELGGLVGYQVRFNDSTSPLSLVKVMTDGILLSEIKRDPFLYQYKVIIIDEAHERSLNIDFLLGYLKTLLPKRPDLKIIITSATIDVERFSKHFNGAPIVSVEGRSFAVEVKYLPPQLNEGEAGSSLGLQIEEAIECLVSDERSKQWRMGDVLVFLPGEREIREVAQHLRYCDWRDTEVTPLYARLSNEEQSRIFRSHSGRRIVLATNVAETSITVPGIRYVVDTGVARISRYSVRSKIQRLPIEAISQASANQRKGRCGRVAEGICYRLYSEEDFVSRPEFTDPEILRTNLASVVLKMLDSGLGDVRRFPFIDMPEGKLWNDGYKLLFELGAVDQRNKLTSIGRELAKIPIDPKLGRVLFEASQTGCLAHALIVASGLAVQDPRERPAEKKQAADQAHSQFKDKDSDFVSFINLFVAYEEQRQELGSSQLKKYAQKNYISFMRMREWRELHRQLLLATKAWSKSDAVPHSQAPPQSPSQPLAQTQDANYEILHKALLSGFLSNIARHDDKREYLACRNKKVQMFPGSVLAKSKSKWIVSAELVETQFLYARVNARIEPDWVEDLAAHLVKKSWSEPHWQAKRGQVLAYEKVTLYGLEIVPKRLVNFSAIDPVISREVFIRSGLVEDGYFGKVKAIEQNRNTIRRLEEIEDRTRRKDVVVDEETLFALYESVLPPNIVSAASFEKWHARSDDKIKASLVFDIQNLKQDAAADFDPNMYPDELENNGIKLPLSYAFNPGAADDGITLSVPARAIRQVTATRLEKLVPGLLKEKCIQLIKNLPRTIRKHFVPVPDTILKIYDKIESSDEPLLEALTRELKYLRGIEVPLDAWNLDLLDPHLRLNVRVLDDKGKLISQGRDLLGLVKDADRYLEQNPASAGAGKANADAKVTTWDFELPESEELVEAGIKLQVYPSLEDKKQFVLKSTSNDQLKSDRITTLGFARLLSFRLEPQIEMLPKTVKGYKEMGLYYAPIGKAATFYDDFTMAAIVNHFRCFEIVRNPAEFEQRWEQCRGDFLNSCESFSLLVVEIMKMHHEVMKCLKGKLNLAVALSVSDLKAQVSNLVYDGFLSHTPYESLKNYPRYLKACALRYEKMTREQGLERRVVPLLNDWWGQYESRLAQHDAQGIFDIELEKFRWLLEEQRVSWFAQQLGTAETVSEKRINKQWQLVRRV
jgi:ATP-dependent RNA helicase HrpA